MSLDFTISRVQKTDVFDINITHNLGKMANAAGIYMHLWRPDELGIKTAGELVEPLTKGLKKLKRSPAKYKKFDSPNGWGMYEHFVPFVEQVLEACKEYPDGEVEVSR